MGNLSGGNLHVFLIALAMVAGSVWTLFFRARVPVPAGWPSFFRAILEMTNTWLALFGAWAGCFFMPIGAMLVLGVLAGGMAFWHWPVALMMFAVLAVWKNR